MAKSPISIPADVLEERLLSALATADLSEAAAAARTRHDDSDLLETLLSDEDEAACDIDLDDPE